ncbi:unnamed protein product [Calypogeia fissa]
MTIIDWEHVHVRDPPPPGDMLWYKAHGLLMYAAFAVFFPLGVFGVRYARYHNRFRHWFQFHWALQVLGVFLATGAVSIALRQFENTRDTTHGCIGFVLTFLILLQPIFALFRPDEDSEYRGYWEFSHWLIGTGGIILGWVNIFKGLDLYFEDWPGAGSQLILTVLFTVQVTIIGFLYLLFDRKHREKSHYPDDSMVPLIVSTSATKGSQFLTKV